MDLKQLTAILLFSIAVMALLGCVEPGPDGGSGGTGLVEQPEQSVGPDYHDSEQAAFDALGQELDEIPEMSPEDLEAMLGE